MPFAGLLYSYFSGGLTTRQWRHEPPAPNFWTKKIGPRILTQFKYLRSLIFITPFGHRQRCRYTCRRKAKIDSSLCISMPYRLYRYYMRRNARTTFSMPECAKTHLQQCRISKFFRGRTPGEGRGRERRRRPLASGPQNHNPPLAIIDVELVS